MHKLLLSILPYLTTVPVAMDVSATAMLKDHWTALKTNTQLARAVGVGLGLLLGAGTYIYVAYSQKVPLTSDDIVPIIVAALVVAVLGGGLYKLGSPFVKLALGAIQVWGSTGQLPALPGMPEAVPADPATTAAVTTPPPAPKAVPPPPAGKP